MLWGKVVYVKFNIYVHTMIKTEVLGLAVILVPYEK